MSDQDDAAAAVVVGDVMLPGIEDVGIREGTVDRDGIAAQAADERGERDLTVDRREHATHLAEARRLLVHDKELLVGGGDEVAVARRIEGDGRIDVEAVDARLARRVPGLHAGLAVRLHDGGVEVPVAHVVGIWSAEPVGVIAVDGALVARVRIGGARWRPGAGEHRGEQGEERRRTRGSHGRTMAHPEPRREAPKSVRRRRRRAPGGCSR